MPRSRLRPRALAIAWLVIVAGATRAGDEQRGTLAERNRETIGALFATEPHRDTGSNLAMSNSKHRKSSKNTLSKMSGPEIFEDPDYLIDSNARIPHVRVKRNANLFDSPPEAIAKPLYEKVSPRHTDQRRVSRKIFKRFFSDEANPADENEAEYSNIFDDDDFDMPGAFLSDQLSKKRNSLEDVYPEVLDHTHQKERNNSIERNKQEKNQNILNFSPSEHSHHTIDTRELIRKKRDRNEAKEKDVDAEWEECNADNNDNNSEYYYDDEIKQDIPNLKDERQAIQPKLAAVDYHVDADVADRNSKFQSNTKSKAKSISVKDNQFDKRKISSENDQLLENNKKLNTKKNDLHLTGNNERLESLTDKGVITGNSTNSVNVLNHHKTRSEKIKKSSNNNQLRKKVIKEKIRIYPSIKKKSKVSKNVVSKIGSTKLTVIETSVPQNIINNHQKSKSVAMIHNTNNIHNDAFIKANKKISKLEGVNDHKNVFINENNDLSNSDANYHNKLNCCNDQDKENKVLYPNDKERYKKNKNLLVKKIPSGNSVKEVQIHLKDAALQNQKNTQNLVQVNKKQTELNKTENSIGELKDLLGKLIVKVEDLHSIMSEMKDMTNDRQKLIRTEQLTRSQFPVDSQRSEGSCVHNKSPTSAPKATRCHPRWGPWTDWSGCSVTCGRGSRSRSRSCIRRCGDFSTEFQERNCRHLACPPKSKFLGMF